MIPNAFEYKKASSVDEAISLMNEDSRILAGGHSLIPALKLRLDEPGQLIDISSIESIRVIRDNENSITIGAAATHAEIANNEALSQHAPMMAIAAHTIGDIQVRNAGTIGGSMAHADPAADWPAVLLAADANVVIKHANGQREVDIDQFFKGFYETALEDGEIITAIRIPKTSFNAHSTYAKFKQPASRFAIVGCAAAVELDGNTVKNARIGMTGLSYNAFRCVSIENALKGKELNESNIDEAIVDVTEGNDVMHDHYASVKYRTHLASVYIKRALMDLIK